MTNTNRQSRTERESEERDQHRQTGAYRTAMDVQETTMNQGQQAIRQTAELQRSFAQIALQGIESQQSAQQQAFEFTKAAIGSYVDTMNSMLPSVQDAQQQFAEGAANTGAELTQQLQQSGQEMGRQTEQVAQEMGQQAQEVGQEMGQQAQHVGQEMGQQARQSGRQTGRQLQQTGQEAGQQTQRGTRQFGQQQGRRAAQGPGQQPTGSGQGTGEFQRTEPPHERGIQPPAGGQRGGGYQPPQQAGQPSHQQTGQPSHQQTGQPSHQQTGQPSHQQTGQAQARQTPSQGTQTGPSGRQFEQQQSRPPGTTGRSGGSAGRQFGSWETTDFEESSAHRGGREPPMHLQRREPTQTRTSGRESGRREIPIGSSPGPTERAGSSEDRDTEYGTRSNAGGESTEGTDIGNDEPTTE